MSSARPPVRQTRAERWSEHPWLKLIVAIATIVAGVVAVVALAVTLRAPPVVTPSPTPDPESSPPSQPTSPSFSPTVSAASQCLDDRYAPVDCREPHRLERVEGPCSIAGMLSYMSGRAGTDVVLAEVRPWSGACVIESPAEVAETAAEALARGNDDAWRRCLDDRRSRLVPCSEEHTGEYIATGQTRKASPEDCAAAAESYMGQTLDNVSALLTVRVVDESDPDPNAPRCLIAVRGRQPLTASVRALGVSPVPIRR